MKTPQMQEICNDAQSNKGCISCKLHTKEVGCLKNYRIDVEQAYRLYKAQNNDIKAEQIMVDYQKLERKYGLE